MRAVLKKVAVDRNGAVTFEAIVPLEPIISEASRSSAGSLQDGRSPERTQPSRPASAIAERGGKKPSLPGSSRRSRKPAPEPQEASGSSQTDEPGRYLKSPPSQCAARWPQSPASA